MAEETRGDRLERELAEVRETVKQLASVIGVGLEALRARAQVADDSIGALKFEVGDRHAVSDHIYGERVERTYAPDADLEPRYTPDGYTIWDLNKDGTYGKDHVPAIDLTRYNAMLPSFGIPLPRGLPPPIPMDDLPSPVDGPDLTAEPGLASLELIRIRVFAWHGIVNGGVDAIKRTYKDGSVRVSLADFDNGRDFLLPHEYEELK